MVLKIYWGSLNRISNYGKITSSSIFYRQSEIWMPKRTDGPLCWHSHWPEILILGLLCQWWTILSKLLLFFKSTIIMHSQFFDPTTSQFQQHLLIKHSLVFCHIMFNCFIGIVNCTDALRHVTMFEVSRTSTWKDNYLLMYLYLRLFSFYWRDEHCYLMRSVGMVFKVLTLAVNLVVE